MTAKPKPVITDATLTDRQFKAGRNAAIAKSPDRAAKPRRFSWEGE